MNDGLIVNGKTLHPDMKAMLDARANAGPAETIAEQRTAWTAYSQALSQPHPDDMKVEDRDLPLPHGAVTVRVYTPAAANENASCVIYSHGGGFMKGDLDSSDTFAWGVAQDTNSVVISVDYRLGPSTPFPPPLTTSTARSAMSPRTQRLRHRPRPYRGLRRQRRRQPRPRRRALRPATAAVRRSSPSRSSIRGRASSSPAVPTRRMPTRRA